MNDEQKQAVEYNKGPLLIVAGAGTGKTFAIIEKIKYLLSKKKALPQEILALTFTEKAAYEMEERVDKAMPYGYFQMLISTFHGFADQILKEEAGHIGLNSGFKLMTEAESIIFLRKNLFLFNLKYFRPLGNPNKFLESLLKHFNRLKDEDISPSEYLKWTKKAHNEEIEKYKELSEAYVKYQALKIKAGVFDFSDLIFYLNQLFIKRPAILKKYQTRFKYVLVDEFQDTNIAQYNLIKLLCPPKKNPKLTVVGDDSQAIYKFRGASVSNIIGFINDYKKAKQVTLIKNYRSLQPILDAAYQLIKNNDPDTLEAKLGISKALIATKKPEIKTKIDLIKFHFSEKVEDEAEYIAKEISKLHQAEKTCKFSDFAILVRANNHSDAFIRALNRAGIPYQFLGPGSLYKKEEIKDLIAYLKIMYDIEDSVSLYRVLIMDIFDMDKKDLAFLIAFARRINQSLFQTLEIYLSFQKQELTQKEFEIYKNYLPFIKEITRTKLFEIYKMIKKHLGMLKKETAGQILYYFFEATGYLNKLITYKTDKEEKIALNVSKFFGQLKNFENEHEDASVTAVVEYLEMSIELGESPMAAKTDISEYDAVNILTVHSAKGLEFPVVFMVNLTKNRFPTIQRKETIPLAEELIKEILPTGDYHLEEERRLFYVGITRAMTKVYLTAAKFYGEGKRQNKISPFVFESMGEEKIRKYELIKQEEKNQLSIFDYKKIEEQIIKQKNPITNFSYSQIETYNTCPLQYKYQYILRLPTQTTAPLAFGNTIHKTLQRFYQEFLQDNKIDREKLIEIFKESWIPIGYQSADHEKDKKLNGEKILNDFFDKFHNQKLRIIALERNFKIKLRDDIFIVGKIDRIDYVNDKTLEIIDYKTGRKPDDKKLKKNVQLSIYAMASDSNKELILSLYYLEEMEKVSFKKSDLDIPEVKEKITETIDEIKTSSFEARPNPSYCKFCPFKMICPYAWQ